jgi:Protein of unknown function (DUF3619)
MTTDEKKFASNIKALLDRSAAGLDARVSDRLATARAAALGRLGVPQAEAALAGAGHGALPGSRPLVTQAKFWVGIALLAAAAFGWQQWQAFQQVEEAEEIDAQLLSSDLPIDAYLDRGFQVWLKTGAPR